MNIALLAVYTVQIYTHAVSSRQWVSLALPKIQKEGYSPYRGCPVGVRTVLLLIADQVFLLTEGCG